MLLIPKADGEKGLNSVAYTLNQTRPLTKPVDAKTPAAPRRAEALDPNGSALSPTELTKPWSSMTGQQWFSSETAKPDSLIRLGFRFAPGGVHLSKTMMLAELRAVLDASPSVDPAEIEEAVVAGNVLAKATGSARRLSLSRLNTLYGVLKPKPVQAVALQLWPRNTLGRPLIALLCALAREPLLRMTAQPILSLPVGTGVRWPEIAKAVGVCYPDRYATKMLKSLSQNCASTWTQSGHLHGKVDKRRSVAEPSPEAAAFAALLGSLCGFGGPALLHSPWMQVLDRNDSDLLSLLRRAESIGLAQLRAGGGVIQIDVREPMANILGVPEIANRR